MILPALLVLFVMVLLLGTDVLTVAVCGAALTV